MTDITIKGELCLCLEGKRLYDEYCAVYDDVNKTDDEMIVEWDAYYNHVINCDNCRYI